MIQTILNFLPYLGIAVGANILLGVYYNIERLKSGFSAAKLIGGLSKAVIVSCAFIGVAFVFDKISLEVAMADYKLKPDMVMYSAILVYIGKDIENLMKILGVTEVLSGAKVKPKSADAEPAPATEAAAPAATLIER